MMGTGRFFPWLTISAVGLTSAATLIAGGEWVAFDRTQVFTEAPWQLVTAHWWHVDATHLAWNAGALALIGGMLERHGRTLLVGALLAGMEAVNLLLVSELATVQYYCGLSGVLNALLFVLLWRLWVEYRAPVVAITAGMCVIKILVELTLGSAVFTETEWPAYPAAHLAGCFGAAIYVALYGTRSAWSDRRVSRNSTGTQSRRNEMSRLEPWPSR